MVMPSFFRSGHAFTYVLLMAAASAASAQSSSASDPLGRWVTANGNLEVEIAPCGAALCGAVTKVLGNRSMTAGGGDMQPADARPALGMMILRDFKPTEADGASGQPPKEWAGQIYNRENGKTYHCNMSVSTADNAAGELVLHAYVGLPLFGKTQRWSRAIGAQ